MPFMGTQGCEPLPNHLSLPSGRTGLSPELPSSQCWPLCVCLSLVLACLSKLSTKEESFLSLLGYTLFLSPSTSLVDSPVSPGYILHNLTFVACLCHLLLHSLVVCRCCGALPSTIFCCHYLVTIGSLRPRPLPKQFSLG